MERKLKFDPKKVEFDGHSVRLIIDDIEELKSRLMREQAEMLKEILEEIPEEAAENQIIG